MAFTGPTYQDYVNSLPVGSEGDIKPPISEQQWNAMGSADRFKQIGGGMIVGRDDPRYADLASHAGGEAGRALTVAGGQFDPAHNVGRNGEGRDVQAYTDPAQVYQGDGWNVHNPSNETPDLQKQGGMSDKQKAIMLAAMMAGGAYAGGAFGGAEVAGAGALDFAPMAAFPETTIGGLGPAFEAGGAAAGAGAAAGGGGGGLGSLGAESMAGGSQFVGPPASAMDVGVTGPMASLPSTSVGSLPSSGGSALSRLAGSLGNNPMGTARLVGGLASLGAAGKGNGGSGGGSGGSSPTDPGSIIEQMARTNRVNQTTPLGSRQWHQDANGQWSVEDSMDPTELANFQNVQGLNASTTDMARQRLAALLAAPHSKASRPLSAGGFNIGG